MPRNADLDKLLREVDSLTGGAEPQVEEEQQFEAPKPSAKSGSSFLNTLGGFFISKVDDEGEHPHADSPPPTPNTVSEMATTVEIPQFEVTQAHGEDLSQKHLAEIYSAAGVDESTFTVDKLAALLQDPTLKDQPLSTKTLVLNMALKAQNVSPTVPVNDAVMRDRSLDAYQQMLNQRALQTEQNNSAQIQQINEDVKRFLEQKNAEMDKLRSENSEVKRQAEVFAARRLQEEQRLAQIIVPLLEGQPNPITTGN